MADVWQRKVALIAGSNTIGVFRELFNYICAQDAAELHPAAAAADRGISGIKGLPLTAGQRGELGG